MAKSTDRSIKRKVVRTAAAGKCLDRLGWHVNGERAETRKLCFYVDAILRQLMAKRGAFGSSTCRMALRRAGALPLASISRRSGETLSPANASRLTVRLAAAS